MKKTLQLLLVFCALVLRSQTLLPSTSLVYAHFNSTGTNLVALNPAQPAAAYTVVMNNLLPSSPSGIAIGPSFGFTNAPNPTFWASKSGTFWYYDGTTFVNTNHASYGYNPGGSKNYLYDYNGTTGDVYIYNGTGASTLLISATTSTYTGPWDIVGDDQDNFYLLRLANPQSLIVYNSSGVQTCSYSIAPGTPPSGSSGPVGVGGFAIVGNTVMATSTSAGYLAGVMSGSTITFSPYVNPSGLGYMDYASYPRSTAFTTTITASPHGSITCASPSIILTASAALSPVTYSWTGPGITGSLNTPTIQVSTVGIYTCALTYTDCPNKKSTSTFAVMSNTLPLTPSITANPLILDCNNPTINLSVTENSATTSYLWSGPGVQGSNQTQTISVNAPGTYTASLISLISGCTGSASIPIASTIASLNITATLSGNFRCLPGPALTITASGATNYTWTPASSLSGSFSPVVSANPTLSTTYTVAGAIGVCTGSAAVTVSVNNTPSVLVSSPNTSVCSGKTINLTSVGADSFTWNPGGVTGTVVSVNPLSTTIYTVVGQNGNCFSSGNHTITTFPNPTLSASSPQPMICEGGITQLMVNGAPNFTWQPGNLSGPSHTISPLSSTVYTVSGSNVFGCTSSSTLGIVVTPYPLLSFSPSSATICSGVATSFSVSGAASYSWQTGTSGSVALITPTVTRTYSVIGTTNGCSSIDSVAVTVISSPTVNASSSSSTVCAGNSLSLIATGAVQYTWMPGNINNALITVTPNTQTTYTVNGASANGCKNTATLSVMAYSLPVVSFSSSQTSICIGNTAQLTAAGAVNYTWNPGVLTGNSVFVAPGLTTTYSVSASNTTGCVTNTLLTLTVHPLPNLSILHPTAVCANTNFTLAASGASSYSWSPGALSGSLISTAVSQPGTIQYTLLGSNLGCTNTALATLTVNPLPNLTISASQSTLCSGSSATLSVSGAASYSWSAGASNNASIVVSPSVNTNYQVSGSSLLGCNSSSTVLIVVNALPEYTVSGIPATLCSGAHTTLQANSAQSLSYTWTPGNVFSNSMSVQPFSNTSYTLSAQNSSGCLSSTLITLSVTSLPNITAQATPVVLCSGDNAVLNASGATSYTWIPGGITGSSVSVNPNSSLIYAVTGFDGSCQNTNTVALTVNASPTLVLASTLPTLCSGESTTLTAFGATNYTWQPVNLGTSQIIVNPAASTIFSVTGINASNCDDTKTISVTVLPSPVLSITASHSFVCIGETITLTATGAQNYTWNTGNQTADITISPIASDTYTVFGSDTNGCEAAGTITVNVSLCTGLNAFVGREETIRLFPSPNDGEFSIYIPQFEQKLIEVYSTLGKLILQKKAEENLSKINLKTQANGIYFVIIKENGTLLEQLKVIKN